MPKVLRGLGMFVHGEILPIYQAVPILRMGAGITLDLAVLKCVAELKNKNQKLRVLYSLLKYREFRLG